MKRLSVLTFFLLSILVLSVQAYEIQVESSSESEIVLAITDLKTVDVRLLNIEAKAETDTVSDTYTVDANLRIEGEKILIKADISPIFKDYSSDQIQSIVVSGTIELDGQQEEFGKRVSFRPDAVKQRAAAPLLEESPSMIYVVVGLALVLVLFVLIVFNKKPSRKKQTSTTKKISKKRKGKKKKAMKKAKKRL